MPTAGAIPFSPTGPSGGAARVFTCNTCSVVFDTSEEQRSHMREPWQ
jgi:hypothetical protein